MKMIRERPCQRRHHRVTAPLHVQVGGKEIYETADWSLGGVKITGIRTELLEIDSDVTLNLDLPFQGFDIRFEVPAKIIRSDAETRTLCCEFVSLDERSRDLMKHFIEELIRGKMATIDDTICRIDVPVTPISTEPDPNPLQEMNIRRWPTKTILMTGLYILLGLFVFGYIIVLAYTHATQLEVSSAVVSAPLQVMRMPVDGIVRPVGLREGARVRAGDPIARIEDRRLQVRIDDATIKVSQSRDQLRRAEQTFELESERIKLYQVISRVDRDVAAAQLSARKEALNAADANLQRIQTLWVRGFSTKVQMDEARRRQSAEAAALREAELMLEQAIVMNGVAGRRHYNHKEFVSDLDMLVIEMDEFRSDFQAAVLHLESLQDVRDDLVVRAPFDGRIVKLFQAGAMNVLRDEPLAVLEMDAPTTVTAFLQQEEALQIALNDEATVFLPALNRYVKAVIVGIDRNSAFLDENFSLYRWHDADQRTAIVSLRLSEEDMAASNAPEIRAGLPATVIFTRRETAIFYGGPERSL